MPISISLNLPDEQATLDFGKQLADELKSGCVVYLHGELGAGKTTLVRGILRGLGYADRVKSPTYTLVERYDFDQCAVFHFDLYRLGDPEELEFLGIRDYLDNKAVILVEWPERGEGFLAAADVDIKLAYLPQGRQIECRALTDKGRSCLQSLDRYASKTE